MDQRVLAPCRMAQHVPRAIRPPRGLLLAVALGACLPAMAQLEDFRTRQLMQELSELRRAVHEQGRRIEQLEREIARLTGDAAGARAVPGEAPDALPADRAWLAPASWDRLRIGMTEQQVLDILGYPTSARTAAGATAKTLFYTVQVGPTGFLSGRIELENGRVRAIDRPALR